MAKITQAQLDAAWQNALAGNKVTIILEVPCEVVPSTDISPVDDVVILPVVEYLEGRAIAKPGKPHVVLWELKGWNDAHLKDPPQERGAMLAHPVEMANRTFIADNAPVTLYPESIKVDGGGLAFRVHLDDEDIELYMKDSEIAF